jgi:dihydroflavonol-4-reductase
METCFLTGGTGFVGANLARLLIEKGFHVRALARKGSSLKNLEGLSLEIIEGDLSDIAALEVGCRGARYAFHCAADYRLWVNDPALMYEVNVGGTVSVIKAASTAGCEKIIHCSSVAAVKPRADHLPANESSIYSGESEIVSHYKKSKYLAEKEALEQARRGIPVVVVNPAAPIGAYDIKPTPTGKIVVDFLNGRIPSYIDTGLNVVHVKDAAWGHFLAAQKGRVGERYILGGENMTFKTLLETLADISGRAAPKFKTPYALAYLFATLDSARARVFGGEPLAPLDAIKMARNYMWFDSSKSERELGYRPSSARGALKDAVEWFTDNGYVPKNALRSLKTCSS